MRLIQCRAATRAASDTMRVIQRLLLLTIFLHFTSISAADETLTVTVYYPLGYVWVGPHQAIPVLSRYVMSVSLKTSQPGPRTTPKPFMSTPTPSGPVTSSVTPVTSSATPNVTSNVTSSVTPSTTPIVTQTDPVFSETPTTTTTRRGDN